MGIRYQPKGTTADTMALGYVLGQKKASAARADQQARYARQRSDELRAFRRQQEMVNFKDQLKLKAEQRSMQQQMQQFEAREQVKFDMDMMEFQVNEQHRIEQNLTQRKEYEQTLKLFHEDDSIDEDERPRLLRRIHDKYYSDRAGSDPRPEKPLTMEQMFMQRMQAQQEAPAEGAGKALDQTSKERIMLQAGGDPDKALEIARKEGFDV